MEAREEEEEKLEEERLLPEDEESMEDDTAISELEELRVWDNCVVELGKGIGLEVLVLAEFEAGLPLGPFTVFSPQEKSRESAKIVE